MGTLIDGIQECWLGATRHSVIYDTEEHEFSSREFWAHVKGRTNIMIFVETESGSLFGSFHSKVPLQQETWVEDDDCHFLFTLRNPWHTKPKLFKLNPDWKKTLFIYGDDQSTDVLGVFSGYWVSNNPSSFVRTLFVNGYAHSPLINSKLFVGSEWPDTFSISHLFCLQFF
ncbi:hypothetical protein EIN_086620 [Entamoeba invadens IP1]|uniref:hypothetical protein n=1 Tax=Entamoeba invadens IP1 TaxID=370355 RepID=UPI0002C3D629|nr:hypothetical protein EIN_086620 [Entamoeba invadens IP1]ELP85380.1 hypothetical protein EIN_086620 [Entamoeba invadens IP1]|eukprot:XP_004184726.1 hypothetical protein EIN_086620 [Entamoeba invadens IP1]